jgi:hypothetical protein
LYYASHLSQERALNKRVVWNIPTCM